MALDEFLDRNRSPLIEVRLAGGGFECLIAVDPPGPGGSRRVPRFYDERISDLLGEVPCLVDRNGVQPCAVGRLPEACAAMNRTNINTQLLTIEAALTGRRDHVYQAAMLDPHTAAELSIDQIVELCDALIDAHGQWLPALH